MLPHTVHCTHCSASKQTPTCSKWPTGGETIAIKSWGDDMIAHGLKQSSNWKVKRPQRASRASGATIGAFELKRTNVQQTSGTYPSSDSPRDSKQADPISQQPLLPGRTQPAIRSRWKTGRGSDLISPIHRRREFCPLQVTVGVAPQLKTLQRAFHFNARLLSLGCSMNI